MIPETERQCPVFVPSRLRSPYSVSSEKRTPSLAWPRPCSRRRRTAAPVRSSLLLIISGRTARPFPGSRWRSCRAAGSGGVTAKAGRRKKPRSRGSLLARGHVALPAFHFDGATLQLTVGIKRLSLLAIWKRCLGPQTYS